MHTGMQDWAIPPALAMLVTEGGAVSDTPDTLAAPECMSIAQESDGRIVLQWHAVEGVTRYRLYREADLTHPVSPGDIERYVLAVLADSSIEMLHFGWVDEHNEGDYQVVSVAVYDICPSTSTPECSESSSRWWGVRAVRSEFGRDTYSNITVTRLGGVTSGESVQVLSTRVDPSGWGSVKKGQRSQ